MVIPFQEGLIPNECWRGSAGCVGELKPCLNAWKPCGLSGARKGLQVLREGLIPNCGGDGGFDCLQGGNCSR
jgi:hypothetical protein